MRLVRRVLATVVGVVLLLPSGVAAGDTLRRPDPVGDVERSVIGSSSYAPIPTQIEGDIISTRVSHGLHAIRIGIRLRELTTVTNGNFHRLSILSNRRFRAIEIDAFPGHWEGHAVTTNAHGRVVGCAVTHHIDYETNRVVVKVPRSCLGRHPKWVRVAIRTTVAGTQYAYADDGRTTGLATGTYYGRRVYR
jgi:hypothetical protein